MNEKKAKAARRAIRTRIVEPVGSSKATEALLVLTKLNMSPRQMRRQFSVSLRSLARGSFPGAGR